MDSDTTLAFTFDILCLVSSLIFLKGFKDKNDDNNAIDYKISQMKQLKFSFLNKQFLTVSH